MIDFALDFKLYLEKLSENFSICLSRTPVISTHIYDLAHLNHVRVVTMIYHTWKQIVIDNRRKK